MGLLETRHDRFSDRKDISGGLGGGTDRRHYDGEGHSYPGDVREPCSGPVLFPSSSIQTPERKVVVVKTLTTRRVASRVASDGCSTSPDKGRVERGSSVSLS